MNNRRERICIISPCYNEAEVIETFYRELKSILGSMSELDHEILFVDDGSTDDTLAHLNNLARSDDRVRVVSLSRNFGHQVALTAGLDAARGDAVILLDSDLQHPPALIPEMVQRWRQGYQVVSAVRNGTADASCFKRLSSKAFYWLLNRLSDTRIETGAADFCLLSRPAHRALRKMPERHRFLRGMISWIGFKRAFVPYVASARAAGKSKYSLWQMLNLALDAIFSFSALPIKLATRLGLVITVLGFVYLCYVLACYFLGDLVRGWSSLISVILIIGGLQMAFIGLIGEYLARVFEEVKGRPLYFLKQAPKRRWRRQAVWPLKGPVH